MDESSRKHFLKGLSDRDPEVRKNAIQRIGTYLGVAGVEPICSTLSDGDYDVRHQAILVLLNMTDGPMSSKAMAVEDPGKLAGAVEPLIAALNATRSRLANLAGRKNSGMYVDGNQEDHELFFMGDVINALGRIGDLRTEPVLSAFVKENPSGFYEEKAAQALEAIRKRSGYNKG